MANELKRKHFLIVIVAAILFAGCAQHKPVAIEPECPPCTGASSHDLTWAGPLMDHRQQLSAWCQSVGPVYIAPYPGMEPVDLATSGLIVMTWNIHVGWGHLKTVLDSLPRDAAVVVFLQEIARRSNDVPHDPPAGVKVPHRLGPTDIEDIAPIARKFNMSLIYIPSMGNGRGTYEDRGCAILSRLPITEITGVELPWMKQRRVAIMATVLAKRNGADWPLRVMSVHLDTPLRRSLQATALANFVAQQNQQKPLPTIIGGDLNSWFGVRDAAVGKIDRVVPRVEECGHRKTFHVLGVPLLRLDHLFTTLPKEMRAKCLIEKDFYGSDHRPMMLYFTFSTFSQPLQQKNRYSTHDLSTIQSLSCPKKAR